MSGQSSLADSQSRIARLAALGKTWGTIKYFHPYLAYKNIDWDKALLDAIPKVNQARGAAEFASAVQGMLAALGDPVTRVAGKPETRTSPPDRLHPLVALDAAGILTITVNNYGDLRGVPAIQQVNALSADIAKSKAVIFDFRSAAGANEQLREMISSRFGARVLAPLAAGLAGPGQRFREYRGFPTIIRPSAYDDGFYVRSGESLPQTADTTLRPVAFILNEGSELPDLALAMHAAGRAFIVMEGSATDACCVEARTLVLPDGVTVRFRVSEVVFNGNSTGFTPDAVVPAGSAPSVAIDAARRLLRTSPSPVRRGDPAALASLQPLQPYPAAVLPTLEYRLLAAFQVWAAIEYFYPHKNMIQGSWGDVIIESIHRMETAASDIDYAMAISAMLVRIRDSHAFARPQSADIGWASKVRGDFQPAVRLRMVDGVPIIAEVAGAVASGVIKPGDEVVAIDGKPFRERVELLSRIFSVSTPNRFDFMTEANLLGSPNEKPAVVTLRGVDGMMSQATLVRKKFGFSDVNRSRGEAILMLPGNIAYVELSRITPSDVDAMFERIKEKRAVIMDFRYGPRTGPPIFSRLYKEEYTVTELDGVPIVSARDSPQDVPFSPSMGATFRKDIYQRDSKPGYAGKVLVLIDASNQSRDEHGILAMKAAGAMLIGATTSGALGQIAAFNLPGGLEARFSGYDCRTPDGRAVQGVGIAPDLIVKPTREGLRVGRDEVLEKAIEFLGAHNIRN